MARRKNQSAAAINFDSAVDVSRPTVSHTQPLLPSAAAIPFRKLLPATYTNHAAATANLYRATAANEKE